MQSVLISPSWFSMYDQVFEIISLLTAIFVAYYSYRVYRYTDQPKWRTMASAFLLIAMSFGIKALTDVGIRAQIAQSGGIHSLAQVLEISTALATGYFAMRFFMLLGLVLLLKLAFNIENNRLLVLLAFFSILTTFLSHSSYYAFHIAAAVMLAFIMEFMFRNYRSKKTKPALMVLCSFVLLFASQLCFIFVGELQSLYAIGESLQLGGFIILIINHVFMLRK